MEMPCFVCGRALEPALPDVHDRPANQPNHAVVFRANGQYGSVAFDPMDGTYLELNICDWCLAGGSARVVVCRGPIALGSFSGVLVDSDHSPWNPPELPHDDGPAGG